MKKTVIRIFVIISILACFITKKSFADTSFTVGLQNGITVNSGETLEIPVVLYNIFIEDSVQKGIVYFTCELNYDENVFEFVSFEPNNPRFEVETENGKKRFYLGEITYNEQNKKLVFQVSAEYLEYFKDSVNEYTNVGTFKFNVKDNLKTGDYYINTTEVSGENDEIDFKGIGHSAAIRVIGYNEIEEIEDFNEKLEEGIQIVEDNNKPLKIEINQNKEGTVVEIIPNEEEGIEIGKIIVDNTELERENGKYSFNSEPWNTYCIYFYGEDGKFLGSKNILVNGDEDTNINTDSNTPDDDNKTEDDKKDDNKTENDKIEDDKKDDDKKDENIKEDTNEGEDVNKSPQTGDYVYIAIIMLTTLTCTWIIIYFKKNNI